VTIIGGGGMHISKDCPRIGKIQSAFHEGCGPLGWVERYPHELL
jgi:hypothetical protein